MDLIFVCIAPCITGRDIGLLSMLPYLADTVPCGLPTNRDKKVVVLWVNFITGYVVALVVLAAPAFFVLVVCPTSSLRLVACCRYCYYLIRKFANGRLVVPINEQTFAASFSVYFAEEIKCCKKFQWNWPTRRCNIWFNFSQAMERPLGFEIFATLKASTLSVELNTLWMCLNQACLW